MSYFLPRQSTLAGLLFLCCAGVAQAETCAKDGLLACDLSLIAPVSATLFCGSQIPFEVIYTITNNTPAPKNFSYELIEGTVPNAIGSVLIDIADTTCPNPATSQSGTLPANSSCYVYLNVLPDSTCDESIAFNWEIELDGTYPQSGPVISTLPVTEEPAPIPPSPPSPPVFICPSSEGTAPLCSTTNFCVFGSNGIYNTNHGGFPLGTDYTKLYSCDAGTSPSTTMQLTALHDMSGGTLYVNDLTAIAAESDITALLDAFATEALMYCATGLGFPIPPGNNLGNGAEYPVLPRGLYCFNTSQATAYLRGQLILEGSPTDQFIFVMPNGFHVDYSLLYNPDGNSVAFTGGAVPANVWWVVYNTRNANPAAKITPGLGLVSYLSPGSFQGNLYSVGNITVGNYANMSATRLFSSQGSVTLNSNAVILP